MSRRVEAHIRAGTLDTPCLCGFGRGRPPLLWREAAKIDNLKAPEDNPELQATLEALRGMVEEDPRFDDLVPWIYREVKKNRMVITPDGDVVPQDPGTGEQGEPLGIPHILDWYQSNSPTRQGVDLMSLKGADKLTPIIEAWDEELQSKMDTGKIVQQDDGSQIVHQYDNGWTMRQLVTRDNCKVEGEAMGHCVKWDSYQTAVENGEKAIFSLRDEENKPHATFEIDPETDEEGNPAKSAKGLALPFNGKIVQIQGKANQEPDEDYRPYIKEFFDESFDEGNSPYAPTRQNTLRHPTDADSFKKFYADQENDPDGDTETFFHHGNPYGIKKLKDEYGIPHRGEASKRQEGDPDWDRAVLGMLDADPEDLPMIYETLEREGELDNFRRSIENRLPDVENSFYRNQYVKDVDPFNEGSDFAPNPDMLDPDSGGFDRQWGNWPFMKSLYPSLPVDRDPSGQSQWRDEEGGLTFPRDEQGNAITPPPHEDQMSLFSKTKTAAIAPVYFRWNFSPKTGVSLGDNERDLDAFVKYREGSGADEDRGYAYRIGNGWRLTDDEHRAVEDPYVVAQVVKKLEQYR